jgi:tetratricopeptide (TPR) repeat protein
MTATDQWGCPVTASSDEVALIERVTTDYVTMSPEVVTHLPALGEGGPMARGMLSMLLTQSHQPGPVAQARQLADEALADGHLVSARERIHLEAARAWANSDTATTIDAFGAVLADHPTDILALWTRYLLTFSVGRIAEMTATVTEAAPRWPSDLPLASYLDGMESFALEESGSYRRAEELGRRGTDRDPSDLWAIHAVAHVMEMEARRDEGIAWVESHTGVMGGGGFAGHLWWHLAIQQWAVGRYDQALACFDEGVYPGASTEGLDLSNAVALLARLESTGIDVGDRWTRLAEPAAIRIGQHTHPFNDTHLVLGLARAGARDDAHQLVEGMRAWSQGDNLAAEVLRAVGVTVGEAMLAFGDGEWRRVVELMDPVADEIWRLGGSNAQRFLYPIVTETARARADG